MSVAKVIEIIAEGKTIEDAMNSAIAEVSKSIKNIKHIDVDHIHANVSGNKIVSFRVITKVSFVVEH